MTPRVAVIIPCYRATGKVGSVVDGVIKCRETLKELCMLEVIVVDDACPELSWREIGENAGIRIIHNPRNEGVGGATLTGLRAAGKGEFSAMVKLDADGQHRPQYLIDLIPYLLKQRETDMVLVKGTRYRWPSSQDGIPWVRRIGSVLLEPIARAALGCRSLTDICNGYLGLNSLSCRYLLLERLGPRIELRYLFESSILVRSRWLGIEIREFSMMPHYSSDWSSSMDSSTMVLPLLLFWSRAAVERIRRTYVRSLNLGSGLFVTSATSAVIACYLWLSRVGPGIAMKEEVSAGTASAFTTASATALIGLIVFFLYDYRAGYDVKVLSFPTLLEDIEDSW